MKRCILSVLLFLNCICAVSFKIPLQHTGASLTGVLTLDSKPLAHVLVSLYRLDDGRLTYLEKVASQTGDDGGFSFDHLLDGRYILIVGSLEKRFYQGELQINRPAIRKDITLRSSSVSIDSRASLGHKWREYNDLIDFAFAPGSDNVVLAFNDMHLELVDMPSGKQIARRQLPAVLDSMAFNSKDNHVLAITGAASLWNWDTTANTLKGGNLPGPRPYFAKIDPGCRMLLTASKIGPNSDIELRVLAGMRKVWRDTSSTDYPWFFAFGDKERFVAVKEDRRYLSLLNPLSAGSEPTRLKWTPHKITGLAISKDESFVAVASGDRFVSVVDLRTGSWIRSKFPKQVKDIAFFPDSKGLVGVSDNGRLVVKSSLEDDSSVEIDSVPHARKIGFSQEGHWMLVLSDNKTGEIRRLENSKKVAQ